MVFIDTSEAFRKKAGESLIAFEQKSWFTRKIWYTINWKKWKSVRVMNWLKENMADPFIMRIAEDHNFIEIEDVDERVIEILRKVRKTFSYIYDKQQFGVSEYWQTPKEMWKNKKGDCEDFTVLILLLARLSNVDWRRIMLVTGDVKSRKGTAGHAWVRYIPYRFPLAAAYLDGTYWVTTAKIGHRPVFLDKVKPYTEFIPIRKRNKVVDYQMKSSKYLNRWWMCNDKFEWGAPKKPKFMF